MLEILYDLQLNQKQKESLLAGAFLICHFADGSLSLFSVSLRRELCVLSAEQPLTRGPASRRRNQKEGNRGLRLRAGDIVT